MKLIKNSFLYCGLSGLLLGAPVSLWLALRSGLSPWVELILISVAVGMLLGTPLAVKVMTGKDGFTFYRDVIPIFATVTIALRWLHQPVLPYLDVTAVGSVVFLACGRIGCLSAGCCYGRPARIGVRYRHVHAEMGFPSALVGVRLFPIQAVESMWVLVLVGCAIRLVRYHAPAGDAFALCVSGYSLGRFFLEFARGDAERPYWLGFSLPQWVSLMLVVAVTIGAAETLPGSKLLLAPFTLIAISMLLVRAIRLCQDGGRFELMQPRHIHALAETMNRVALTSGARQEIPSTPEKHGRIGVASTYRGIMISASELEHGGRRLKHYCLSAGVPPLSFSNARLLGHLISQLRHSSAKFRLLRGRHGVVHVIFHG
jgi:hypothetical protein